MFKERQERRRVLCASSETRWLRLTSAEGPHGEERRINSASERGG